MLRLIRLWFFLFAWVGISVQAQDMYRDWNRRICPVLDTPFRTFRGLDITHTLQSDTGTTGWGDSVSVTDLGLWGRLPGWENEYGGELEVRGHIDLRVLEGLKAGSGVDRLHTLTMLRGVFAWHQRYVGGFGMQARMQPGFSSSVNKPSSDSFFMPVGLTFVQALHPDFALFLGGDYYSGFAAGFDPTAGIVYSYHDEVWIQVSYPHTRFSVRPQGGRFQIGIGADILRWPEYELGRDDERGRIRFRENRGYAELSWDTRGYTQFDLRVGYTFGRKAMFDVGPTVEFEDTPFIAIGFSAIL